MRRRARSRARGVRARALARWPRTRAVQHRLNSARCILHCIVYSYVPFLGTWSRGLCDIDDVGSGVGEDNGNNITPARAVLCKLVNRLSAHIHLIVCAIAIGIILGTTRLIPVEITRVSQQSFVCSTMRASSRDQSDISLRHTDLVWFRPRGLQRSCSRSGKATQRDSARNRTRAERLPQSSG